MIRRARFFTKAALAIWTLVSILFILWQVENHNTETLLLAKSEALASWRKDVTYRSWAAGHGSVYVPPTEKTPPNPYLSLVPDRDVVTTTGKRLTLINPAYMTRQVFELDRDRFGNVGRITSLRPINPSNAPDPWERVALAALERGEAEVSSVESVDGKPFMRLMRPLAVEQGCLNCHAAQGYKVGDIRGGISVSIPMEHFYTLRTAILRKDFLAIGFLWIFGSGLVLAAGRRVERDIRQIEKSEREIKTQLAFRAGIVECAADGICVCHNIADPPYVEFTVWNSRMTEITGYSMEDINRLGWYQTAYPDPDVRALAIARMDRMRQGDNLRDEEWEITRSDGTTRHLSISTSVLQESGGNVNVLAVMHDVTNRKIAEKSLQHERDRAQGYLDTVEAIIVALDQEGKITLINKKGCRLLGYGEEDLVGRSWFSECLPQPYGTEKLYPFFLKLMKGETEGLEHFENPVVTRNGELRDISWHNTLLRDEHGRITGTLSAGDDVTERKRTEEEKEKLLQQLQQAMKMEAVGRLAGGVAHDFNNLLTAILGNLSLAGMKLSPSEPAAEMLSEATKAAERAALLTKQLLAFSRKQMIEPKVVDLNALVAGLQTMLSRLIGEDILLRTGLGKDLWAVKVDPGQFEQVLVNLAVNSRDAMPDGGELVIETSNVELDEAFCALHPGFHPGLSVLLAVSDTGHGMTEEIKAHVFEPFFTTKRKGSGTGLGLASTYGVVKQSGGWIEVCSEVGKGTTLKIYLPRFEGEIPEPEKEDGPQDLPEGTETVLVVEDEDVVRNLCTSVLERWGYSVLSASNGKDAIDVARKHGGRIELLMTDVVMPGMNGADLATQLVLMRPDMKVLFTSGYTEDAIVNRGVLDKDIHFIAKPYSLSALSKKIRGVLDGE